MKFVIGPSNIQGQGLFALEDILEKEVLLIVTSVNTSPIPQKDYAHLGEEYILDERLRYLNHSCSPNAILLNREGDYNLTAARKIRCGEEITVDYNVTEVPNHALKCNCHSQSCRGHFFIS